MTFLYRQPARTIATTLFALSLFGCRAEDSRLHEQTSSSDLSQATDEVSSELKALAVDGSIDVKAPSASSFRYTIRIGAIEHVYGKGFALDLRSKSYNSCESHLIYDLLSNEIVVTPQTYGSPSCEAIALPAPVRYSKGSAEYRSKLDELLVLLKQIESGYYNLPADARVSPVIAHLEAVAKNG